MIYILLFLVLFTGCCKTEVIDEDSMNGFDAKLIYNASCDESLIIKNNEKSFKLNLSNISPWKIQFCNIDGDEIELAIGVKKKSPYHSEKVKRLFLYNLSFKNKRLKPKLRISRLSNPLVDFCMLDIDGDGFDEIISIEKDIKNCFDFNGYDYANAFVFEKNYRSKKLNAKPYFIDKNGSIKVENEIYELFLDGGEIKWQRKDI